MDPRSRTGADGATPGWQWSAEASGEDAALPPKDEDWATTSGFDAGPRPRPRLQATIHDSDDDSQRSSGAPDASWFTEDDARTPLEHNHFHYRRGEEDRDDGSYAFVYERRNPEPRQPTAEEEAQERYRRRFKPRTCRICFETVLPTFEDTTGGMPEADHDHGMMGEQEEVVEPVGLGAAVNAVGEATAGFRDRVAGAVTSALPPFMRSRMPRVRYISESPEDGRLISPCHCKGSQKYVHEGCLQAWRLARPMAERNYWKCPTCGFEYRMQRLSWGRMISNKVTRALLTLLVFGLTLFVLGFIADPLMDLWVDPSGVIMDTFLDLGDFDTDDDFLAQVHEALHTEDGGGSLANIVEPASWWEHFLKGFFSLGIVGVVKTFLVVSPFTWFNLRGAGLGRGRRRAAGGGRGRYDSMGWIFILVGAFTFLGAAWKGISYVSGRFLEHASERIIDIGSDEPDDDENEEDAGHSPGQSE
ncbi:hypothetical protein SEUCBS139899_001587 [Sporothrix eucalyptigena]